MSPTPADWRALQDAIAGDVVLPGSPEYDVVRKPAMVRFHDVRPRAVVPCETDLDAVEVIGFTKRFGLGVAIRSGGHCFAGRSSTDAVLIDVSPMRSVTVRAGVVTVGAGTRLGELYDALDRHGLTIAAGCGPTVGIAGLALGGGLGILGRRGGLTCDSLRRARIVLADARIINCDEHHEEDLFWALRGAGGGNFGVVTSLVFDSVPAPPATGFHLVWPANVAAAVIEAWQAWAPDAPDELAASLLIKAGRDVDLPVAVNLFGAMVGTESDTVKLCDEFVARTGHDPTSTSLVPASYRETKQYLADLGDQMDGAAPEVSVQPGPVYSKSEFFRQPLPTDATAALVDSLVTGRRRGESRALDFTPWAGAYNTVPETATAFVHRAERFLLKHELVLDPDASTPATAAGRRWLTRSWALVHPWGSGGVYPNFPDPELENPGRAYYGINLERLVGVKRRYDPDHVFGVGLGGVPLAD
jgi:FAD/FMN-containing dehydrogenase